MSLDNENIVQARFLETVDQLGLKFPIAEISEKTGFSQSTVSQYLSRKDNARIVSTKFLRKFCEVYEIDFNKLTRIDKKIIPSGLGNIEEKIIQQQATINVLRVMVESLTSQVSGKSIALVSGDTKKAIKEEALRLFDEL